MARNERFKEEAFARQLQDIIDPSKPDMHYINTQTAMKSYDMLRHWAKHMGYHELQTSQPHERVYLVVSDLKLKLSFQQYSGSIRGQKGCFAPRRGIFLHEKDIETLHEKHWAVEIDGRYYELVRNDRNISSFSSEALVEDNDRQIVARIFMGSTHIEHRGLNSIGKAVIATQSIYELTRDNCHRFARVFSSLALCAYHPLNTIPNLPFNIEEHIATRGLNQRTGFKGNPGGKYFGLSILSYSEEHRHRASRTVGEGVEWTYYPSQLGSELRRTVRRLEQKTSTDGEGQTTYFDEFYVKQEQTSYFIDRDPALLYEVQHCVPVDRNPYLSLIRFDKVTSYTVIPRQSTEGYKPKYSAYGMVAGPYGVTKSNGKFLMLKPTEIIKDKTNVWRNGNGERLEQQYKSTMDRRLANLRDLFGGRTTRHDFSYRVPTWHLFDIVGLGKVDPLVLLGGIVGATAILPALVRRQGSRSRSSSVDDSSEASYISSPSRLRTRSRSIPRETQYHRNPPIEYPLKYQPPYISDFDTRKRVMNYV